MSCFNDTLLFVNDGDWLVIGSIRGIATPLMALTRVT